MTHGSLFSGIGGFDLAAEWAGFDNVFQCEKDPFCQKVLKKHWPNKILYDDITTTDFGEHAGTIDIITGGFPCQPFSTAGKRRGTEDDRYLWPAMLSAITTIQSRWVIGENVPGLVNWSNGLVFEQVQADLEAAGYEVFPFILPACGVGAPHIRSRIWFVAYAMQNRIKCGHNQDDQSRQLFQTEEREENKFIDQLACQSGSSAYADFQRLSQRLHTEQSRNAEKNGTLAGRRFDRTFTTPNWREFPTQSPVCVGDDGLPNRMDRIAALGNAIVSQVAFEIFECIKEFEKLRA